MTTPSELNESTLKRIQGLLALATNNPSQQEAEAAMGKAQELCAKYNVQLAELEQTSGRKEDTGKRVKDTYTRSAMFQWQRKLWAQIADSYYCHYTSVPVYKTNSLGVQMKSTYHHYFIGRESNVLMARMMGDYLEETISKLCPYTPGKDSSKSWASWKEGCAERLCERLSNKKWEMEHQATKPTETSTECTAVTVRNMSQYEYDENYRFMYGEESYQSMISWRNRPSEPTQEVTVVEPVEIKPETDKERAARLKREEKEAAANSRWWDAYKARKQREADKKDQNALRQGRVTANDIGLDAQIGATQTKGGLN